MFGLQHRRADPLWDVAASVQVLPASCFPADSYVGELVERARRDGEYGVLVARRHPTGWFVQAVRRNDLSVEELATLRELVTVRAYLLLQNGPLAPVWSSDPLVGAWHSALQPVAGDLAVVAGGSRGV